VLLGVGITLAVVALIAIVVGIMGFPDDNSF
jgi:hypothetical protein